MFERREGKCLRSLIASRPKEECLEQKTTFRNFFESGAKYAEVCIPEDKGFSSVERTYRNIASKYGFSSYVSIAKRGDRLFMIRK